VPTAAWKSTFPSMSDNAILVIADQKQFPPAVFLASRLAALRGSRNVEIVVASDWQPGLEQAREFGVPFTLLDIAKVHADLALPTSGYFTRAAYHSLFVPALLHSKYRRLIYLDVDTYCESEKIFSLFDLDMRGYAVAAVRDLVVPFHPNPFNAAELLSTLAIKPHDRLGAKYLNSGVLLIDLAAYRSERIEKRALGVTREQRLELRMVDQTVFNAILRMQWLELSPSFNMVTRAWATFVRRFAPPVIVHFTGSVKPWHRAFVDDHPVRRELPGFLKDTPWSTYIDDVNPPPRLIGNVRIPEPPSPQRPSWVGENLTALVRVLRDTPFADVEQGLTTLDFSALPAVE